MSPLLPGATVFSGPGRALVNATQTAFDRHYPLRLGPSFIWTQIAQEFAIHVNAHAEELRSRIVTHQGKQTIDVTIDDYAKGDPGIDWSKICEAFGVQIGRRIASAEIAELFNINFSDSTDVDVTCGHISLMDTTQKYFHYCCRTRCGIPWIELRGTVDDWKKVRAKAELMRGFDVKFWDEGGPISEWLEDLLPVLDEFVKAAEGNADPEFWGAVSNIGGLTGSGQSMPTGQYLMGWVRVFYREAASGWFQSWSFVKEHGIEEMLARIRSAAEKGRKLDKADLQKLAELGVTHYGLELPSGVSTAPVKMTWAREGVTEELKFLASGLVYQHADGALEPRNAWAITAKRLPGEAVTADDDDE